MVMDSLIAGMEQMKLVPLSTFRFFLFVLVIAIVHSSNKDFRTYNYIT